MRNILLLDILGIIVGQETLRLKFEVRIPSPDCGINSTVGTCEDVFDGIYDNLGQISCNDFNDCGIEYTHVITNETKVETIQDSDNPRPIDENSKFILLTGQFPPIFSEECEAFIFNFRDEERDLDYATYCPGMDIWKEPERQPARIEWSSKKSVDIFEERQLDDFSFAGFHMYKFSHFKINGIFYFIGGEKYYPWLDTTEYTERDLNKGVWRLYNDRLHQTTSSFQFAGGERNIRITRNAFATRKDEKSGWMCGTVFETTKCYSFDGQKFKDEPDLTTGRTDGAQMIDSSEHGLLIVGGRNKIAYENNAAEPTTGLVEYASVENLENNKWRIKTCFEYPTISIVENKMIEINGDIWSFGGHRSQPLDDVFRLTKTTGENNCIFEWVRERKMLSTRSGFSIVQNRFENSILLIGATLKGKNKPMERWTFTSSWSPSNVKQKESRNKLLVYYSPVAIPEDDWPAENASSIFQDISFPPKPTLPDWVDANFTKCIQNLFPDRHVNHFDTIEECFEDTEGRDDLAEALNCAYCGLEEENRDFMYAFCNATGTLQEEQAFTCEDYDQLRSSMLVINGLQLSQEEDSPTINISWTTVTKITEEVNEQTVLETIQENFENVDNIIPDDQLWIPSDALESIKEDIADIEDVDDIKEDDPDEPEEPEDPEEDPIDMEFVILFSVFSVAEAFTIFGLGISIFQSEWVAVIFFGVLLGILPLLQVVSYYWLIEEIRPEIAYGLIPGITVFGILIFIGLWRVVSRKKSQSSSSSARSKKQSKNKVSDIELSSVTTNDSRSLANNPYAIKE